MVVVTYFQRERVSVMASDVVRIETLKSQPTLAVI